MARTAVTPSTSTPHDTRLRLDSPGEAGREAPRTWARGSLPNPLESVRSFPSVGALVGSAVDLRGLTLAELRPA